MNWSRRALLTAATATLAAPPATRAATRSIKFLTDGGPVGRHSYYFLTKARGYYGEEGLDVEIIGGRGSAAVVKEVAAGAVDIGFADAGTLVLARGNEDVPVKMVAVVYGSAPHALIVLDESGIRGPKDLAGKTLADVAGSANYVLFASYAKLAGLDPASVKWVFADFNALGAMLVTRQVDAVGQFTIGLPLLEKRAAPQKLRPLAYRDAGLDIYSNGVIARDKLLESDPDLVRAFVRATMRGLKDAIADPVAAGTAINAALPLVDRESAIGEMRRVAEIAENADTKAHGLGWLDQSKMQRTIDVIAEASTLKRKPTVAEVMAEGYAVRS